MEGCGAVAVQECMTCFLLPSPPHTSALSLLCPPPALQLKAEAAARLLEQEAAAARTAEAIAKVCCAHRAAVLMTRPPLHSTMILMKVQGASERA